MDLPPSEKNSIINTDTINSKINNCFNLIKLQNRSLVPTFQPFLQLVFFPQKGKI